MHSYKCIGFLWGVLVVLLVPFDNLALAESGLRNSSRPWTSQSEIVYVAGKGD